MKLGIQRVLNLQGLVFESLEVLEERRWCEAANINLYHLPLDPLGCPSLAKINAAIKYIDLPGSCYVHCKYGVDRTGVVCMVHRLLHEGCSFGTAVGQMIDYGFHLEHYARWLETLKEYHVQRNTDGPTPFSARVRP